jgi:hypothetical protein
VKSTNTKLFYSALVSTLMLLSATTYAVDSIASQKPEEEIVAEFLTCVKDFNDKRTYVQFIDAVIAKVINNKPYFDNYFKQNYPHLTAEGFKAALESARKAGNALSAGTALRSYYQLLPKDVTYAVLLAGITRRMKVA